MTSRLCRREAAGLLRAWYAGRVTYKRLLQGVDVAAARFGRDAGVETAMCAVDDGFDAFLMSRPTWTERWGWRDLLTFGPPEPRHPPREWKRGLARLVLWLRAGETEISRHGGAWWPFVSPAAFERAARGAHLLGR